MPFFPKKDRYNDAAKRGYWVQLMEGDMPANGSLRARVEALEAEVARLKERLGETRRDKGDWVKEITGTFANDPIYDEAMRLGREYRESLRPKPRRPRKRKT
jgi:hypothetical protein